MNIRAEQSTIEPASGSEITEPAEVLQPEEVTILNSQDYKARASASMSEGLTSSPTGPISEDPLAAAKTRDAALENDEASMTEAALVAIEQANAIARFPVNSVVENIQHKEFSLPRLERLYARWDEGAEAFFVSWETRCELVYEIHKETAKPGCNGGFSAALRRIKLPASTAYDMIARHKIRIGEMEDPDAYDPRHAKLNHLLRVGFVVVALNFANGLRNLARQDDDCRFGPCVLAFCAAAPIPVSNYRVQVFVYSDDVMIGTFTIVEAYPNLAEIQNNRAAPEPCKLLAGLAPKTQNGGPYTWVQTINTSSVGDGVMISIPTGETDGNGIAVTFGIYMEIKAHPQHPPSATVI